MIIFLTLSPVVPTTYINTGYYVIVWIPLGSTCIMFVAGLGEFDIFHNGRFKPCCHGLVFWYDRARNKIFQAMISDFSDLSWPYSSFGLPGQFSLWLCITQ